MTQLLWNAATSCSLTAKLGSSLSWWPTA